MVESFVAAMLLLCGIILTVRLGFFRPSVVFNALCAPFRRAGQRDRDGISPLRGLCTALGGCVGTGNIIGVTACITIGGIGSVFWIWLCSFFSMATKYAEVYLSVKSSVEDGLGSPVHYIRRYLGKPYMPLGYLWCVLCLLSAIFTGASVQSNAISEAVVSISPANSNFTRVRLLCGIILGITVFIILTGGLRRISSFASALVPSMCVLYMAACIVCIAASGKSLLSITEDIISEAFMPRSAAAGSVTYAVLRAMRLGISRGVFSNEAGMGTSPLALSSTSSKDAHAQGGMGIWEIIIDTFILCTATAFLVICCVPESVLYDSSVSPVSMVSYAFSSVFPHDASSIILSCAIILFAFTSILGWSYYGAACARMLPSDALKRTIAKIYPAAFCIMLAAGCLFPLGFIWDAAATAGMVISIPNVFALLTITKRKRSHLGQLKKSPFG